MMFTHKNLMTVCCAAVLAFGLAACGGGGGGGGDGMPAVIDGGIPGTGDTGPICDAGPSQACVDARQAELEAIEADDDATVGDRNAALMALGAAQTALSGANAADTVSGLIDDAVTATADITDESTPAAVAVGRAAIDAAQESLDGLVDGMENVSADATAALQGRIDALDAGYSPIEMTVDANADTAAAATKRTAIGVEAGQETDAADGLGGSDAPITEDGAVGEYTLSIKHGETSITVEGATDAADVKFMQAMDFRDGRTMHTRTMDADADGNVMTEVAIVSTDIKAPRAVAFAKWEDDAGEAPHTITVRQDGQDVDTDNPADSHLVEAGAGNVNLPLIMSATFAGPPVGSSSSSATHNFLPADDDADDETLGNQPREAAMVDGTYRGADGTYTCSGTGDDANCSVTVNDKGVVAGITGRWIFTPDMGATSDQADYQYLSYGFWLMKTTDADGATTYNEVETFAEATGFDETTADGIDDVEGTAMYKGGSVGVYVKDVLDDQATIVSSTSGHFSADVELTATFGGNVLPNDQFTIGGEITGFVLQHGEANDWAVGLGLADFSGGRADGGAPGESLPGDSHTNTFSGVAIGDSTAAAGSWSGTFHGVAGEVGTDPVVNTKPVAVVGEFNANFRDGTAAGGFGANIKK